MAPLLAVRVAREVTLLSRSKPEEGLMLRVRMDVRISITVFEDGLTDFIDLMPVQKLPKERYQLLSSGGCVR